MIISFACHVSDKRRKPTRLMMMLLFPDYIQVSTSRLFYSRGAGANFSCEIDESKYNFSRAHLRSENHPSLVHSLTRMIHNFKHGRWRKISFFVEEIPHKWCGSVQTFCFGKNGAGEDFEWQDFEIGGK